MNPAAFADAKAEDVPAAAAGNGSTGAPEGGVGAVAVSAAKDLIHPVPGKVAPLDDYRTVMVQRAIFQSIASMGLPGMPPILSARSLVTGF